MLGGNKTENYDFQSKRCLEKENCLILTRCWNHIFQRNFWAKKNPLEHPDGVFGHLEFYCEGHYIFWSTKNGFFTKYVS